MTPAACASFLRHTTLPIVERDYYLSKLFQFLYLPLELRFQLGSAEEEIRERLEQFLDGIPAESRLDLFDWSRFYADTLHYDLEGVLGHLPLHLHDCRTPCEVSIASDQPDPHLPQPPPLRMAKKRWVEEGWPDRLKRARGDRVQKEAAHECRVSFETYKKWEQGVRRPADRNMQAALNYINSSRQRH
jgi:hypothetical protein